MATAKASTQRVFFALWPDDNTRQRLMACFGQSLFASQPGRPVTAQNLHLTLHYMGQLELPVIAELQQAAALIELPAFSLRLDQFGSFPSAGVLWLGCTHTPEPLLYLHQTLASQLLAAGIVPEQRAFQPHITLMRRYKSSLATETSPLDQPLNWAVSRFALLESVSSTQGVYYRPLAVYPLLAAQ